VGGWKESDIYALSEERGKTGIGNGVESAAWLLKSLKNGDFLKRSEENEESALLHLSLYETKAEGSLRSGHEELLRKARK